jgi:hypothetical protein
VIRRRDRDLSRRDSFDNVFWDVIGDVFIRGSGCRLSSNIIVFERL